MDSTLIIAEMACSHEGDLSLAKKIIDATARANADAIQLQIWSLENMMSPQRKEHELLRNIEFTKEQWTEIVSYSRKTYSDLKIYVCVYEHSTIDFIDSLKIDGYKLNSSDLSNPLVLDKVAAKNKPINLSVGASTILEIENAIKRIRDISNSKITLMYGFQSFPTKPENVHMNFMNKLTEHFKLPVGYQDHCDADHDSGFWLPAATLGMNVSILEKHITHDRSKRGLDHESALNPLEFVKFVEMVRCIESAKGMFDVRPFTKEELTYREFQKKSIVVTKDMKKGSILNLNDISFIRAEKLGVAPDKLEMIIGKKLLKDKSAFDAIYKDDIA
jgi:N,N'-diacetyllegionaminate synthase